MATPIDAIKSSLPPATDPLTFLAILEYNLTPDILPDLYDILQDPALTSNIGWDLISLLIPLLPASKACLNEVARLGNPRECVLKATESLRAIDFEERPQSVTPPAADTRSDLETKEQIAKTPDKDVDAHKKDPDTEEEDLEPRTPLLTFNVLLSVLSTLQPRIKAARPSRFLASTLQPVLATYLDATNALPTSQINEITSEVTRFVKTISGKKRPHLPPRKSTQDSLPTLKAGPDPEAQDEAPSDEELALSRRLLQSFITHVLEDYLLALDEGLSWSARFYEKIRPSHIVPGRPAYSQRYMEEAPLQDQESTVGELVAIAHDLDLSNDALVKAILQPPLEPDEEDESPSSPLEIPLSRKGAVFLLTSRVSSSILFGSKATPPALSIFPDHAAMLDVFIGIEGPDTTGKEPEAVLDAIIALGLWIVDSRGLENMEAVEDETFNRYLQAFSLISANHQSPTIRYHAHLLCSFVLHAHPSDLVRLSFILDTLQHCPFENLKASAVGWIKEEILATSAELAEDRPVTVFTTPVALDTLAPFLFPDLHPVLATPPLLEAWTSLKACFSFYLATLNFYYLLLSASHLQPLLKSTSLHKTEDVDFSYLEPLRQASARFEEALTSSDGPLREEEGEAGINAGRADLKLLDNALDLVANARKALAA